MSGPETWLGNIQRAAHRVRVWDAEWNVLGDSDVGLDDRFTPEACAAAQAEFAAQNRMAWERDQRGPWWRRLFRHGSGECLRGDR